MRCQITTFPKQREGERGWEGGILMQVDCLFARTGIGDDEFTEGALQKKISPNASRETLIEYHYLN